MDKGKIEITSSYLDKLETNELLELYNCMSTFLSYLKTCILDIEDNND